jgi:hypothetical protein
VYRASLIAEQAIIPPQGKIDLHRLRHAIPPEAAIRRSQTTAISSLGRLGGVEFK